MTDFDDEYTVTDDEIERYRKDHTPPPSDIDDSRGKLSYSINRLNHDINNHDKILLNADDTLVIPSLNFTKVITTYFYISTLWKSANCSSPGTHLILDPRCV